MPVTLDMPAEPLTSSASPPLDTTAADEAAAMLDSFDSIPELENAELPDESGDDEPEGNTDPTDVIDEPAADAATEEKPKKKRGRKKKSEQAAEESAAIAEPAAAQPAADPATPSLATPPAPPPAPTDRNILDEIALAEVQCERAESVVLSCKEELKDAKKIYDAAVLRLRRLAQAVKNDSDRPLFKQPAATLPADVALPADPSPAAATQPAADPNAWRTVSITELGISEKLVEKLDEAGASNMGQLENLRAEISQGKAKWPKGIGAAKITQIEDAVIAWLSEHRDAAVFGQGEGNPSSAADIAWEDMTAEQQADFINQRCVQLDPDENVEEEFCVPLEPQHTASRAFFEAGYIAGQNGDKASECPWVPGLEMDDWLRGWLKAGKEADDAKNGPPAVVDEIPDDQTIAEETAEVDSLDDL